MLIYTYQKSKKKKKINSKQRELINSWNDILEKHKPKKSIKKDNNSTLSYKLTAPAGRETKSYPSVNTGYYDTFKKEIPTYTGDKMKGIGTLHKSNAVPIFSDEEARDQAAMRR